MANALARLSAALGDRYRIEQFVHEIEITAALSHPHVLPLFDSGKADAFSTTSCPVRHAKLATSPPTNP